VSLVRLSELALRLSGLLCSAVAMLRPFPTRHVILNRARLDDRLANYACKQIKLNLTLPHQVCDTIDNTIDVTGTNCRAMFEVEEDTRC
jgi:hypothetical protein